MYIGHHNLFICSPALGALTKIHRRPQKTSNGAVFLARFSSQVAHSASVADLAYQLYRFYASRWYPLFCRSMFPFIFGVMRPRFIVIGRFSGSEATPTSEPWKVSADTLSEASLVTLVSAYLNDKGP